MKPKWVLALALAAALFVASPLLAQTGGGVGSTPAPPSSVPEISPGSVGSALTLLTGGVLLLRARRRTV